MNGVASPPDAAPFALCGVGVYVDTMSDDLAEPGAAPVPEGYSPLDFGRGYVRQIGPLYRRATGQGFCMGFRVEPHHTNGMRNAHGGMLMSFADMAWGSVVSYERSAYWVTVRLMLDFLSSAKVGEWVEGSGELLSTADDLYIVRGEVWTGDRLLVTGQGVFKPIRAREPHPGEKGFPTPADA